MPRLEGGNPSQRWGTRDRPPGGWGRPRPCGHSCPLASFSGLRPAPYCWPLSLGPPTGSCPSLHPFLAQQFSWKHGIWSRRHAPHSRLGSFLPAARDPGPVPVSGGSWPGMVPQASGPSLTGVDSHSWGPGSPRGAAVLMRRKGLALSQGCAVSRLLRGVRLRGPVAGHCHLHSGSIYLKQTGAMPGAASLADCIPSFPPQGQEATGRCDETEVGTDLERKSPSCNSHWKLLTWPTCLTASEYIF